MVITRMWGSYPKAAFVLHALTLLLFAGFLLDELLTRRDGLIELMLGLAAIATATTLAINTRRARRTGWRGLHDKAGGGDELNSPGNAGRPS